jgi:predicted nucleic acid-binding protein
MVSIPYFPLAHTVTILVSTKQNQKKKKKNIISVGEVKKSFPGLSKNDFISYSVY